MAVDGPDAGRVAGVIQAQREAGCSCSPLDMRNSYRDGPHASILYPIRFYIGESLEVLKDGGTCNDRVPAAGYSPHCASPRSYGDSCMSLFAALRPPREILFGKGQSDAIGAVAARHGSRALVCTDARFAATPIFAKIVDSLTAPESRSTSTTVSSRTCRTTALALCVEEARSFRARTS